MKTAFVFSGQGAQYPGMTASLCEKYEPCRRVLRVMDEVLGCEMSELMLRGSQEELNQTRNTQPCVLAADLAANAALTAHGITADAAAGFSLGEYAALTAAGVFDLETVFAVIKVRAEAMQEAAPAGTGAMAAVMKQDAAAVEALCAEAGGYVVPVNFNSPGQIVVSGDADAVARLVDICRSRKIRAVKLPVSAPFHCRYMDSAAEKLSRLFETVRFCDARIPVYMNVDAQPETDGGRIREKLIRQVNSPVLWEQTVRRMSADGVVRFVEQGPGKTLTGFVKRTLEAPVLCSVEDTETLELTLNTLNGDIG